MSLQFVDFNADGYQDIVTAVWEGTIYLVPGSKEGFGKPEYIKDEQDELILLTRFYDRKTHRYVSTDPNGRGDQLVSVLAWDWDEDGDLDLILGAKNGQVYLRRNQGTPGAARFATKNTMLTAGRGRFEVPGGLTAPRTVDWDGDGLTDLIGGSFKGGAYWYRNVGKRGSPVFAKPVTLVKPGKRGGPERDWYVDPTDFDGDGDLDLLVGGSFMHQPKPRKLTVEETKRWEEVDARLKRLSKEDRQNWEFLDKVRSEQGGDAYRKAYAAWYWKKETQERHKTMSKLGKERYELRPYPSRKSGIWLYRRQGGETKRVKPSSVQGARRIR